MNSLTVNYNSMLLFSNFLLALENHKLSNELCDNVEISSSFLEAIFLQSHSASRLLNNDFLFTLKTAVINNL